MKILIIFLQEVEAFKIKSQQRCPLFIRYARLENI